MTRLENEIIEFCREHKIGEDLPGRLKKLGEEFGELAEAIASGDFRNALLECADMGIVLSHLTFLLSRIDVDMRNSGSLQAMMSVKLDLRREQIRNGKPLKK